MKPKKYKAPKNLSSSKEATLFLIQEELKSRKFFNGLRELGLDNCYYQPHLDGLILANIDLNDECDEVFDFYYNLIETYSAEVTPDKVSLITGASKVYDELMIERKRRFSNLTKATSC